MPALALQFATQVMGSALRGTGIVRPEHDRAGARRDHQYRAGAGPDHGLGHRPCARRRRCRPCEFDRGLDRRADAVVYFRRLERYVGFDPAQWRPQLRQWKRILNVGLPAGGEFAMIFIFMAVVYYVLRVFGAAAQAGFGIGTRVLGLIQMPALAIALAAGPIAGQNFGAGNAARVRETFVKAALDRHRRDDCLHDTCAVAARAAARRLLQRSRRRWRSRRCSCGSSRSTWWRRD